ARWLIEQTAMSFRRGAFRLLPAIVAGTAELAERDRPVAPTLLERLRCPDCRTGALVAVPDAVRCVACGRSFRSEYGVPILYPTAGRDESAALGEAVDRLCDGDAGRRRTVARVARRLRRNEAPPGRLRRVAWRLETLLGRR